MLNLQPTDESTPESSLERLQRLYAAGLDISIDELHAAYQECGDGVQWQEFIERFLREVRNA